MIQRKQTLWLLLAALSSAGVFYFDLYQGYINDNQPVSLYAGREWPLFILGILMSVLPLIAIFLFNNRKRQKNITILSGFINILFIAIAIMMVPSFRERQAGIANDSYWIGMVLPFIGIVFLILSFMGIRRDEKLVRSTDRLR